MAKDRKLFAVNDKSSVVKGTAVLHTAIDRGAEGSPKVYKSIHTAKDGTFCLLHGMSARYNMSFEAAALKTHGCRDIMVPEI